MKLVHKMGCTTVLYPNGDRITVKGTLTLPELEESNAPGRYTRVTPHGKIVVRNYKGSGVKYPPVGWDKL